MITGFLLIMIWFAVSFVAWVTADWMSDREEAAGISLSGASITCMVYWLVWAIILVNR